MDLLIMFLKSKRSLEPNILSHKMLSLRPLLRQLHKLLQRRVAFPTLMLSIFNWRTRTSGYVTLKMAISELVSGLFLICVIGSIMLRFLHARLRKRLKFEQFKFHQYCLRKKFSQKGVMLDISSTQARNHRTRG